MHHSYSLHKIDSEEKFGFSPAAYSRFKFGDDAVAKAFGRSLAEGFIREHLEHKLPTQQMVVVSSPYSFIPTATFAMKNHFVYHLNRWLARKGFPVVQETKVHRTITYKEDYGELDAQERLRLIGNDSFQIDKEFLSDKVVVFLDDIRITGSHERMIMKMVAQYQLDNEIYMLYFAELCNKAIHPNIENYLNYFSVKSIFDLEPVVQDAGFTINTRIVKYLLNYDFEAFRIFLQNQTAEFANLLFDMALGNGYHTIEAYSQNLSFLNQHLQTHTIKHQSHGN